MSMLFSGGCGHCWDSPCTCESDAPWRLEEAAERKREAEAFAAMTPAERVASFSRSIEVPTSALSDPKFDAMMARFRGALS